MATRFALNGVVLAAACLWGSQAWALGLGRLNVQSALGETLKAEIDITSISPEEAASLRLQVASPEAYRSAGVDYNVVLPSAQVQVMRRADGRPYLRVSSERAVLEPFVDVIIEATWASGRLVREYTMLFDPPASRASSPAAQGAAAVVAAAPAPAVAPPAPAPAPAAPAQPPVAAAPVTRQAPPAAPSPRPAPVAPAKPPAAPVAAPAARVEDYRVQPGDSLSRIAGRTARTGVSLDQMLVSLFRGNPQAFVGDNMNRLKSGVVLTVPSAEQAAQLSPREAREVIVAQSDDFAAYRQRLASGATTAADEGAPRQARGQVQAQVNDRKQTATPTPDRLTLSQGGVKPSGAEANISKATQGKDASARLAELNRNVDELKKLQGAAVTAPAPVVAAARPAPAAAPAPKPAPPAPPPPPPPAPKPAPPPPPPPPAPKPAPPPPPPPPPPAPAPAPVPAPAPTPAPVAPTVVAAAPPPQPAPAAKPTVPKPAASAAAPAAAPAAEEPSLLDAMTDNPWLLPGAGVVLALLAGLGLYRMRGRVRKQAGETSFLESRLQPDSFFGASGGQRIDTRDAASGNSSSSSSMSYSLSQLDAIGDVDPVAEADVYLAYGRDLQAEEILKEAMRSTPERMAIRSKLLEVYAKRRDSKAFELLASQMFNLTRGEGEDWSKAQTLGRTIDPENVLYLPGGQPAEVRGASGQVVAEPLGASTQPYTAPVATVFQPAPDARLDQDIDLDLGEAGAPDGGTMAESPTETTQPLSTVAMRRSDDTLDLSQDRADPKTIPVPRSAVSKAPPPAPADGTLDFDLEALSMDPPTVATSVTAPQSAESALDFGDFSISGEDPPEAAPVDGDPLARKLELAEEFRQIGDLEGARDLLEEVVAKAEGALRGKAQGMLDKLA